MVAVEDRVGRLLFRGAGSPVQVDGRARRADLAMGVVVLPQVFPNGALVITRTELQAAAASDD